MGLHTHLQPSAALGHGEGVEKAMPSASAGASCKGAGSKEPLA